MGGLVGSHRPTGSGLERQRAPSHRAPSPRAPRDPQTYQGGWATDKGACDKCMCVRMHGGDNKYNPGLQTEPMQKHMGLTFLAKVGDRCGEW